MKILATVGEMQRAAEDLRMSGGRRIGLVPTMGYLHDGHLSLIRVAKGNAAVVITTIFVNPTQFGPTEDFRTYPRDLVRDTRLAESAGSDILFVPSVEEMYPDGSGTFVTVESLTGVLEGKARPTHFRGVTTVVAKLFNCTKPHVAVFGQKDAQQAQVIRRMVRDLNFDIEVLVAPTVREPDGLAMSSRNVYLSPEERAESTVLFQSLQLAERLIMRGERQCPAITAAMKNLIMTRRSAHIEYISIADATTLEEMATLKSGNAVLVSLAVRFGTTRLIDNLPLTV